MTTGKAPSQGCYEDQMCACVEGGGQENHVCALALQRGKAGYKYKYGVQRFGVGLHLIPLKIMEFKLSPMNLYIYFNRNQRHLTLAASLHPPYLGVSAIDLSGAYF